MSINHTATEPKFYDVGEVAAMFKVSRMTVYRAIASGELPACRFRGRLLVPATVIEGLIQSAIADQASAPSFAGEIGGR